MESVPMSNTGLQVTEKLRKKSASASRSKTCSRSLNLDFHLETSKQPHYPIQDSLIPTSRPEDDSVSSLWLCTLWDAAPKNKGT